MSKSSKFISFFTGIVVPAIAVVVTIVLFFLLKPSETNLPLFIVNLVFTVFLELVFFGWLGFLYLGKNEEKSYVYKLVSGKKTLYYVIIGFIFMLLYNAALTEHISIKFYSLIIVVITLVWVILGSLLKAPVRQKDKAKTNIPKNLDELVAKVSSQASRFNTIQARHNSQGENGIDLLVEEFNSLSQKDVENVFTMIKLNSILNQMDMLLDEAESASDDDYAEIAGHIKAFARQSIGKFEQIKTD